MRSLRSSFAVLLPVAIAGALLLAPPAGAAPAGQPTEIPVAQCAVDINDAGVVLTFSKIYRAGVVTDIPAGMESAGYLNNRGHIAGTSGLTAVLWNGKKLSTIPFVAGDDYAWVAGLNERGDVVGGSHVVGGAEEQQHAWVWRNGTLKVLRGLSDITVATGINDQGQILGRSEVNGSWVPLRWEANGSVTRLDTLGGGTGSGFPEALNNNGEAVGSAFTGPGNAGIAHTVKWYANGDVKSLDPAGYSGGARGINDRGDIVGAAAGSSGIPAAFYRKAGQQMQLLPDSTPNSGNYFAAVNRWGVAAGCNSTDTAVTATTYRPGS